MENTFDLSKIVTEHPGGYPEIIAALQAHQGESHIYKIGKVTHRIKIDRIITEITAAIAATSKAASGTISNSIHYVLMKYRLPVPGDKDWNTPAEKWLKTSLE